ncbi:DUF726-domain-containing protein [Thermothelomyces heterothallicus CBS 203.75]
MPGGDGASAGTAQPVSPSTTSANAKSEQPEPTVAMTIEYDEFGLPVKTYTTAKQDETPVTSTAKPDGPRQTTKAGAGATKGAGQAAKPAEETTGNRRSGDTKNGVEGGSKQGPEDAVPADGTGRATNASRAAAAVSESEHAAAETARPAAKDQEASAEAAKVEDQAVAEARKSEPVTAEERADASKRTSALGTSEFSHQQLTAARPGKTDDDEGEWQPMPAYAPYDIYDDNNKLVAKEYVEEEDETYGYSGLGGAGKGYTKVLLDDDAESATSMDEHTQYLFKDGGGTTTSALDDDTQRDAVSQLQATKELLTEGQRVAYVGLTRLELSSMLKDAEDLAQASSKSKKQLTLAAENMKMWSQKMMIRLYSHMDISSDEQIMIEQLSSHGVMPKDLTPVLMANARVRNPMAEQDGRTSVSSPSSSRPASVASPTGGQLADPPPPPPYAAEDDSELTAPVKTPSQMPTTQKIDIDIRWTVLCDLFLVLIADSIYDARSRLLLEKVAKDLDISWLDICRFEKKVTDALEMQANAETENWNEDEHMENRRKMALKRRYVMMGLATVGGGLVIGLSAGLLAPVIGMGLAAGFTTIGIGGTSGFLAGAGGAAIITSSAAASGGIIGVRAANRRTGAVKTFEYRPLHNNKRVNLIVTVSGWMTGKVDDVRLPFSTVDPVMGDLYSVLWEPEMLTTMGDTINILATEALTQGLQQVLGNTILVALMAALQLPVVLSKLAYLIDNPWAVSLDRATMAGLILADSLIDRNLGTRPVTLVGYSLGSRVIFSCLQELSKKGAFGLVQNVYLFGSPIVVKKDEYLRARSVVSGRFVNGYNRNDWILGYLFRLTNGGIRRVAGLAAIEDIPGIENMDVSEFVVGHMDYRMAMPRLMRECGWLVESDEFTEIEDPDPENYRERQRELISEIEEARKELEREGKGSKGGAFSFFRRKKPPQKQEWEVYEDTKGGKGSKSEDKDGNNHGVLFDVDAIRAEIAKEKQNRKDGGVDEELLQVREIKSTLPPIKLDLNSGPSPPPKTAPRQSRRESKSVELRPRSSSSSTDNTPSSYGRFSSHEPTRSRDDRTPTFPASRAEGSSSSLYHGYGYGSNPSLYHDYNEDDDGIRMTFDTSFDGEQHGQKPASPPSTSTGAWGVPPVPSSSGSGFLDGDDGTAARPEFRSVQTVPNITLADPWADDDEEFGKEKEIQMTFA